MVLTKGCTIPLHYACLTQNPKNLFEIVKALLFAKIDPLKKDNDGKTALDIATFFGQNDVVINFLKKVSKK